MRLVRFVSIGWVAWWQYLMSDVSMAHTAPSTPGSLHNITSVEPRLARYRLYLTLLPIRQHHHHVIADNPLLVEVVLSNLAYNGTRRALIIHHGRNSVRTINVRIQYGGLRPAVQFNGHLMAWCDAPRRMALTLTLALAPALAFVALATTRRPP